LNIHTGNYVCGHIFHAQCLKDWWKAQENQAQEKLDYLLRQLLLPMQRRQLLQLFEVRIKPRYRHCPLCQEKVSPEDSERLERRLQESDDYIWANGGELRGRSLGYMLDTVLLISRAGLRSALNTAIDPGFFARFANTGQPRSIRARSLRLVFWWLPRLVVDLVRWLPRQALAVSRQLISRVVVPGLWLLSSLSFFFFLALIFCDPGRTLVFFFFFFFWTMCIGIR
jgi:hypothetical protein